MAAKANGAAGTKSVTAPSFVPLEDETLAERFSAIIVEFPIKQVARIADCGIDTVKAWRKGRQMPQAEHLFKLARSIPSVRAFLYAEADPSLNSPRAMNAIMTGLQHVAGQRGADGAAARALLRQLHGGDNG